MYEGVPEHLETPLRTWIAESIPNYRAAVRVLTQLRIPSKSARPASQELVGQPTSLLLDIVDCMLKTSTPALDSKIDDLDELLLDSGSAYRVAQYRDGLERRVDPTITSGFKETIQTASANARSGSAADHLRKAWKAAYGLHPDPPQAYPFAIKAVESVAQSIVQTNHAKATLGTMIPEMRQAAHKFTSVIAASGGVSKSGAEPFADLMDQLWKGQTSRHGGQAATRNEAQKEAEAGVHVAVLWYICSPQDQSFASRDIPLPRAAFVH